MKQANVYVGNNLAGVLTEDDLGYEFRYDSYYLRPHPTRNVKAGAAYFRGNFESGRGSVASYTTDETFEIYRKDAVPV